MVPTLPWGWQNVLFLLYHRAMTLVHLLNDDLSWHQRERWERVLTLVADFFRLHHGDLGEVTERAELLREGIGRIDSFIQRNTAVVCPRCRNVCCLNVHGYYDYGDILYIHALGGAPPGYREGIDDGEPCQFLSPLGCTIERSVRPFRCTWYFCGPLLKRMESNPGRPYREFVDHLHQIIELRREMIEEFFGVAGH